MGARADAVADRVGGLARVAGLGDAVANEPVELGKACARVTVVDRRAVDAEQLVEELLVPRLEDNFLVADAGAEKLSPFPDGIVQAAA